jgi:hypothetical protein
MTTYRTICVNIFINIEVHMRKYVLVCKLPFFLVISFCILKHTSILIINLARTKNTYKAFFFFFSIFTFVAITSLNTGIEAISRSG